MRQSGSFARHQILRTFQSFFLLFSFLFVITREWMGLILFIIVASICEKISELFESRLFIIERVSSFEDVESCGYIRIAYNDLIMAGLQLLCFKYHYHKNV